MSFALQKFKAWGILPDGPSKKCLQYAELVISALTTDVDMDLGDDTPGTFWTAAIADSTYGSVATQALAVLQTIDDNVDGLIFSGGEEFLDRLQAAAASGTSYTRTIENHRPNYTFAASNGETSWTILLIWVLEDGQMPVNCSYG